MNGKTVNDQPQKKRHVFLLFKEQRDAIFSGWPAYLALQASCLAFSPTVTNNLVGPGTSTKRTS